MAAKIPRRLEHYVKSAHRMTDAEAAKFAADIDAMEKKNCERSLAAFIKAYWHVVEPNTKLIWGWPLDCMCQHLEAVTRGEITRLLINVPPGFMKSLLVDVFWPAWEWGPKGKSTMRYLCASYSQALTVRDNGRFRRIVMHQDYIKHWGDLFKEKSSHPNIIKVENDMTGWKLATSVGGIGTGERGDRIIIDDANNVIDSESEAMMTNTNIWLREAMPDRLNSQSTGVIINIQQRTAETDASGTLLSCADYVHVMIPMEYDSTRHCATDIGWEDPRTEEGELAWEERFTPEAVEELKRVKGKYAYAGQYQQSPSPRGGGIIKVSDWKLWGNPDDPEDKRYKSFPPMEFVVGSLDSAYTEKQENDYSALTICGVYRDEYDLPKIMLMAAWQQRLELNPLVLRVGQTCKRFKVDKLLIEGKASGLSVAQELKRLFGDEQWGTQIIDPKGDKVARAYAVQHLFNEGVVFAPDREWADTVITQCSQFPKGAHDDLVDSVVMAIKWLRDTGWALRRDERERDILERMQPHGEKIPLYDV